MPRVTEADAKALPVWASRVRKGQCPFCRRKVKEKDLKDDASKREFETSGMCMRCQRKMWPVKGAK